MYDLVQMKCLEYKCIGVRTPKKKVLCEMQSKGTCHNYCCEGDHASFGYIMAYEMSTMLGWKVRMNQRVEVETNPVLPYIRFLRPSHRHLHVKKALALP